ncbi:MAG: NUDIX domain-containing protein [Bacilli bacterium]|nr:NUDIX domain-containing protein [Bacilli bacterium]
MEKTSRVVIIEDDKLIVFFRRKIVDGKEITYYAIPGGHVEGNETGEETAIREVKEELNLDIEILGYLGKIVVGNKQDDYYHAKIVGGELQFGGEELDRNSYENYYEVRKLPIYELDNSGIRALDLVKKAIIQDYEN